MGQPGNEAFILQRRHLVYTAQHYSCTPKFGVSFENYYKVLVLQSQTLTNILCETLATTFYSPVACRMEVYNGTHLNW